MKTEKSKPVKTDYLPLMTLVYGVMIGGITGMYLDSFWTSSFLSETLENPNVRAFYAASAQTSLSWVYFGGGWLAVTLLVEILRAKFAARQANKSKGQSQQVANNG